MSLSHPEGCEQVFTNFHMRFMAEDFECGAHLAPVRSPADNSRTRKAAAKSRRESNFPSRLAFNKHEATACLEAAKSLAWNPRPARGPLCGFVRGHDLCIRASASPSAT